MSTEVSPLWWGITLSFTGKLWQLLKLCNTPISLQSTKEPDKEPSWGGCPLAVPPLSGIKTLPPFRSWLGSCSTEILCTPNSSIKCNHYHLSSILLFLLPVPKQTKTFCSTMPFLSPTPCHQSDLYRPREITHWGTHSYIPPIKKTKQTRRGREGLAVHKQNPRRDHLATSFHCKNQFPPKGTWSHPKQKLQQPCKIPANGKHLLDIVHTLVTSKLMLPRCMCPFKKKNKTLNLIYTRM